MGLYIDVFDTFTYDQTFPLIKTVGFDGFFSSEHLAADPESLKRYSGLAQKYGLRQENCHSTIPGCETVWLPGDAGENYDKVLRTNINNCKEIGVDMLVVHVQTPENADMEAGFSRLAKAVDYARNCGIKLAFENINNPTYLYETLNRFRDQHVGFCYDCGHEACYCYGEDYLDKIGDRLFCTHIHDNDLRSDIHLLPFDGKIDFNKITKQLKNCGYRGNITLEICYANASNGLNAEDFFKKAYAAAARLNDMIFY